MKRWLILFLILSTTVFAVYSNYPRSIENVLISEGGSRYTNHPRDPGGPTKYGITLADVRRFLDTSATAQTVRDLTEPEARDIYEQRYWTVLRCNDLPAGLDYTIFDYGVNSGISRAGRVLRRVLNLPTDRWEVTDDVLEAVRKKGTATTIKLVNTERLRFLKSLRTWKVFGKGWQRRVKSVRAISLNMAGVRPEAGMPIDVFRNLMEPRASLGKAYDDTVQEIVR